MKTSIAAVLIAQLVALAGCGEKSPFQYVDISGTVRYEDSSLLPVHALVINFHPQISPSVAGKSARMGSVLINSATGEFANVVSIKGQKGVVRGKHKVTLHLPGRQPLPPDVASLDYSNPEKTPIEINADDRHFDIRVSRP